MHVRSDNVYEKKALVRFRVCDVDILANDLQ